MSEKKLIVVAGPTASGKTALSIELAKHFNTEIVSADARQFYQELKIGTAVPSDEELAAVKHHFIQSHSIEEHITAGQYEVMALECLDNIFKDKSIVVLVGGSGLFIKAVTKGFHETIAHDESRRQNLNQLLKKKGLKFLQNMLKKTDPKAYKNIDIKNSRRVIRAIEIKEATGKSSIDFKDEPLRKRSFDVLTVGIEWEREQLYERINKRVDLMLKAGLEAEVLSLKDSFHLTALQTVGYQEWQAFFKEECEKEEAVEMIKRNSRRYAKRQMTWFKKTENMQWFKANEHQKAIAHLEAQIKSA
ncbi:UNVERIFIED_CONTAM: hypothetical protein GTU68_026957 [Idotea baltica]|nr:hypothetical protein [Idotea baltica]